MLSFCLKYKHFLAALAVHATLFFALAWYLYGESLLRVTEQDPEGEIFLTENQVLVATLTLSESVGIQDYHPASAVLFKDVDGEAVKISEGTLKGNKIVFPPVSEAGDYVLLVLPSILSSSSRLKFDGEFEGALPSGNGKAGGVYRRGFKILENQSIVSSEIVEEKKEEIMQSSPSSLPSPPVPEVVSPPPKTKRVKSQNKKQLQPQSDIPRESREKNAESEEKTTIDPNVLRFNPILFARQNEEKLQTFAETHFNEKDKNQMIAQGVEETERFKKAYRAPVVGSGEKGRAVRQDKEVEQYLSDMHEIIHELWAWGYLIQLDANFRFNNPQLNNPNLEAKTEIAVDKNGKVVDVRIVRSSSVAVYDAEAVSVSWKSSPLYPPPPQMLSPDDKSYIHWTFWRNQRQCGIFGTKVFVRDGNGNSELNFNRKKVEDLDKKRGISANPQNKTTAGTPTAPIKNTVIPINPLDD